MPAIASAATGWNTAHSFRQGLVTAQQGLIPYNGSSAVRGKGERVIWSAILGLQNAAAHAGAIAN